MSFSQFVNQSPEKFEVRLSDRSIPRVGSFQDFAWDENEFRLVDNQGPVRTLYTSHSTIGSLRRVPCNFKLQFSIRSRESGTLIEGRIRLRKSSIFHLVLIIGFFISGATYLSVHGMLLQLFFLLFPLPVLIFGLYIEYYIFQRKARAFFKHIAGPE